VNDTELKLIKQLKNVSNHSIILMPTFKSLVDFAVLSYVHFIYEVDIPFINGLKDFDDIAVMSKLLRKCGGYFIDKKHLKNDLY
jgi:glycerol-3-phosphate O-acyltransferase